MSVCITVKKISIKVCLSQKCHNANIKICFLFLFGWNMTQVFSSGIHPYKLLWNRHTSFIEKRPLKVTGTPQARMLIFTGVSVSLKETCTFTCLLIRHINTHTHTLTVTSKTHSHKHTHFPVWWSVKMTRMNDNTPEKLSSLRRTLNI